MTRVVRVLPAVLPVVLPAVLSAVLLAGVTVAVAPSAGAGVVLERRVLGYSVRHRPIVAYHLGDARARPVSLVIGQMHGDEHAGVRVVRSVLAHGVSGVNLWVVPTMNPDGDARHTRGNAHGVDLNRNFPYRWTHLSGTNYSGTKPLSEPETRAVYRFLRTLRPARVVSLHQPLLGVDRGDGGALDPAFRTRLARALDLPVKRFVCWSECHGSMTRWYTHARLGVAITVEFGWHPTSHRLTVSVPKGLLRALGGRLRG